MNGKQTFLQKKTYRWPTNTWKDAQHSSLLEKCYWNLQWGITSHWSERVAIIKKSTKINAVEGVEKRELSCTFVWNINWYSHYGEQYGDSLKTRNKTVAWPSNSTSRNILWENHNSKRHMYPNVHFSTIYNRT